MQHKRILVISNAAFFDADSNGRTLSKLFQAYEREKLAQFFVYGNPDQSVCARYYQVSDQDALQSLVKWKTAGGVVKATQTDTRNMEQNKTLSKKLVKRTPFRILLRELAWKFGRWHGTQLYNWIDEFQPEGVFLSVADNLFLPRLAIEVAKKYHIPIYMYSTESYYFIEKNNLTWRPSVFYNIFHTLLKRCYRRLEKRVKLGIFNTPLLQERYEAEFSFPCICAYSPSGIDFQDNTALQKQRVVSYLGNLGLNRHLALIQLAETMQEVAPGTKLDVYGKIPNEVVKEALDNCRAIRYCGVVTYEDVVASMHKSDLVVHAEWNDKVMNQTIQYGFSTKIADSVCSGTPFLAFAHKGLAGIDFLIRNKCAFVAETEEELREQLKVALFDENARRKVIENAKIAREKYFRNTDDIVRIINEEM